MATNFGFKIATNAYKCISMRDSENVITYNRGFSWSANLKVLGVGQSEEDISDCNGLMDVAMVTKFWPK